MDLVTQLRQYRIGPFAIFDFTISVVFMLLLAPLLTRGCRRLGLHVPWQSWPLLTVPISVLTHLVIGRTTPLAAQVVDLRGGIVAKLVVVAFVLLAARGVHRLPRGS